MMSKKIISVGQCIKYEKIICGAIYLMSGFFFLVKGAETNKFLSSVIAMIACINAVYSIIRRRKYDEEKFDEMATENLNRASRMVLRDQALLGVFVLVLTIIFDILKMASGITVPLNKYFVLSPSAFVLLALGTQYIMTGLYFRKLERE